VIMGKPEDEGRVVTVRFNQEQWELIEAAVVAAEESTGYPSNISAVLRQLVQDGLGQA